MKIDETIEYCNNQAEYCENRIVEWNEKFSNRCKVEVEQYRQIAEWLEELKALRDEKEYWDMQNHRAYQQGRQNAVNEMVIKLIQVVDKRYMHDLYLFDVENVALEVLEQLKEQIK